MRVWEDGEMERWTESSLKPFIAISVSASLGDKVERKRISR